MRRRGLAVAWALLTACSAEPVVDPAGAAVCARLAERCDPYTAASLTAADCHRFGHANLTATCVARQAECLAACPSVPDAGADVDGALPTSRCADLAARCDHATTPTGAACHALGHGGDPTACADRYDACVAACEPRDASAD